MNMVVCIKQVPDTTDVRIDPKPIPWSGKAWPPFSTLRRVCDRGGGADQGETGRKGHRALHGPPQAQQVLRDAIAVGADEGILLSDKAFAGADTLATSYTLSQAIRKMGKIDLILCGKQAIDGDTAQVGPGIAAFLDIPQIVFVKKIREITADRIVAERTTEDGYDVIESPCRLWSP